MSDRLDRALVAGGLARSRNHAQDLIRSGRVFVNGSVAERASRPVAPDAALRVSGEAPDWVGRGGQKLDAALRTFAIDGLSVEGKRCIDIGASTGGFTQALLRHRASSVLAVDVGHGQLASIIRDDSRVTDMSGHSIRGLTSSETEGRFEVLVADLSFISLTLVMPDFAELLGHDGDAVMLIKPQFEVGRDRLGKNGIVSDPRLQRQACEGVVSAAERIGWHQKELIESPILGGHGNREFLLWCRS